MRRRDLLKSAAGLALALPRLGRASRPDTLRFVPSSDLPLLDPVVTTARPTRNHAYLVFDTLYGLDQHFTVQPQMVEGHTVEPDELGWTLTLREGLRFHDGEPVLARDCVASIRRFAARNGLAEALMAATDDLSAIDDRRLRFRLKRPFPHLPEALGGPSANVAAIMPERLAATPPTRPVTEMVGSGPYRFLAGEHVSGAHVAYERFGGYVPRPGGSPSFLAGPKIAHFGRIEWLTLPDPATAAAALRTGEVDWWELPSRDLADQLARDRDVTVIPDYASAIGMLRLNHLHPPFDNAAVRRALLVGIDQVEAMTAVAGVDRANWRDGIGLFAAETPLATSAGTELLTGSRDTRAVKEALNAAGYAGERIVVLSVADIADIHALSLVGADQLRRAGLNVDVQEMDFATALRRRLSKAAPDQGGWHAFFTFLDTSYNVNPYGHPALRTDGPAAWDGWPSSPRIEALRAAWLDAADLNTQRRICRDLQMQLWQDVPFIPMGEYFQPTCFRRTLADVPRGFPLFYGIRRA